MVNSSTNLILNGVLKDYRSPHKQMRIFAHELYRRSRDILSIGYSIFQLEKIIKERKITNVSIGRFLDSNSNELGKVLSELISYVLLEDVNIKFQESKNRFYKREYKEKENKNTNALVLFSGGIDSLAGIYWAKNFFKNITGLFCAHSDQAWTIHTVNMINNNMLSDYDIDLKTIHVPRIKKGSYSQLRGFLYILSAGAWLDILNIDNLVLSECGPTMYQPRFGPYDSVTMTTHPVVVELAIRVLEIILGKKINIYLPFENMTKAEVMSSIPDDINITQTHSCITQRFGNHDGTCYGCVIRRLGSIVTNKKDAKYNCNPLINEGTNKDNLLSLLMFSQDLLLSYNKMPLYQIEKIEAYNKYDLFKRFALDNLSAVHLLKNKDTVLVKEVQKIYKDYIDRKGISELEQRINDVKSNNYQINESAN